MWRRYRTSYLSPVPSVATGTARGIKPRRSRSSSSSSEVSESVLDVDELAAGAPIVAECECEEEPLVDGVESDWFASSVAFGRESVAVLVLVVVLLVLDVAAMADEIRVSRRSLISRSVLIRFEV